MSIRRIIAGLAAVALLAGVMATLPTAGAEAAATAPDAQSVLLNPDPADNTAQVLDGVTQAVVDLGSRVIIGGRFTQVKKFDDPTVLVRNNLFAYDKSSGAIDTTFTPQLDGQVTAMLKAPDGKIFVAGQFKNVDGVSAPFLVKLDPVTGARDTSFTPVPSGMVYDIRLSDGVLYLGGTFTKMRNTARSNFAAVNANTGALLPIDVPFTAAVTGTTRVIRMDITPDGSTMIAIGNFTNVAGQTRQNIVKLDLGGGSATVDPWVTDQFRAGTCSTSYDTYVRDIDFSPDGSYFIIGTTGAWFGTSTLCDTTSRWETNVTGVAQPTWRDYTGGDSITAVAATGTMVLAAGHPRWSNNAIPPRGDRKGTGAVDRQGIIALDPESGMAISWNPSRERGIQVNRMTTTPEGLYILSDSSGFGDEWHPRLTYLTVQGGNAPIFVRPTTLPSAFTYAGTAGAVPQSGDTLNLRSYDGTTLGAETAVPGSSTGWSSVRGVVFASDRMYRANSNGTLSVSFDDGATWSSSPSWLTFSNITAMAYGTGVAGGGRLFYTVNNDHNLYARGFSADGGLVSTLLNTVSGNGDGMNWGDTKGLAVIDGKLYHTHSDGTLRRTDLVNGRPVAATTVTISGPLVDGVNWSLTTALYAPPAAVIPPPPPTGPIVADGFDNGFANWTGVSNMTLDPTDSGPTGTAPTAKIDVSGVKAVGTRYLGSDHAQVCSAFSLKLTRITATTVLSRLRTSANGAVARVYISSTRVLYLRSDVAGTYVSTGVQLPLNTWKRLELCAVTGTSGSLQLKVDGVATGAPWSANLGTNPVGAVEIGDAAANNWAASFDDLVVTDPTTP